MICTDLDVTRLPPGALILTPNRRLSAWLIRDHDAAMAQGPNATWERLNAMPLDAWWLQLYQQICLLYTPGETAHPRLLSTRQSTLLWRQVIEQAGAPAADPDGFIQLAQQARTLICRWRLTPTQWQQGEKVEHQQFAQWHRAYLARLQQDNLLDVAALPQWVIEHGNVLRKNLPQQVLLHGFNDHTEPQLLQLGQWLGQSGATVQFSRPPAHQGHCVQAPFNQLNEQFGAAIQWALKEKGKGGRTGIVIPNLQPLRAQIRQLCQQLWSQQPEAVSVHWSQLFNITAGQKLQDYPLVSHAMLLLRALSSELKLQEWSVLLGSPYFPLTESEWLRRDEFVESLREKNLPQLNLSKLERYWQNFNEQPGATNAWISGLDKIRKRMRSQPVSQWLDWMQTLLNETGWCQGRGLDSEEYQVRQRLLETLTTLTELDEWLGNISFDQFRNELMESLKNVQFQAQTDTAPIQIMGVLEAAGLPFERLWVCECEAVNWPQPVNPNPLLPRREQRALNMPGASPERELRYSAQLLDGFRTSSENAIFSWGRQDGDTEHTLSALLEDLPALTAEDLLPLQHRSLEHRQYSDLHDNIEMLPADEFGVPVDQRHARGGSGMIKAQSLCPFKAYGEYRLNIKAQAELAEGVSASDRGSLVHLVLEAFWRKTGDWNALQALIQYPEKMNAELREIITHQLTIFRQQVLLEPEALYRLEEERTFNLVRRWLLDCDGSREPFTVVQMEKKKSLTIGGIELSMTVDRIDTLNDDAQVIIDYKTGVRDSKAWQGERPEEPQLPLYAMLEPERTRGILFGVLHNNKMAYNGLLENRDSFIQGKQGSVKTADNWEEQMQQWREALENLAREFAQGRATVAPLNDMACQYCHLSPVCRIREAARDTD